ncbi:MAG: hypothetical protein IPQ24_02625 [Anaeromyxobacter sp.]|nr:hypothetical protein [Anaeromyxobacter sp.]
MKWILALACTAALAACGGDSKSDCEKGCEKAAAAACVNDDPQAVCVSGCEELLAVPTCQAQAKAFVACAAGAGTFTCDPVDQSSTLEGCDQQASDFLTCLQPM